MGKIQDLREQEKGLPPLRQPPALLAKCQRISTSRHQTERPVP